MDASIARIAAEAMITGEPSDVFAPECVSWHNWDEQEVATVPTVLLGTQQALLVTPDLRLDEVTLHELTDTLFLLRYRVRGTFPGGQTMDAPGVLLVHTAAGKVVRTEEYLDSAQTLALYARYATFVVDNQTVTEPNR